MTTSLFHWRNDDREEHTFPAGSIRVPATAPTGAVITSARKFLITTAAVATLGTLGVVTPGDVADLQRQVPAARTSPAGSVMSDSNTPAAILKRIRRRASLTWGEVGYALGISRRAVHLWLNGGKIAPKHQTALENLDRLVEGAPGHTVDERRARLVEAGPTGRSLLDDMALASRTTRRIPLSTVTVAEQLGPVSDLQPGDVQAPDRRSSMRGQAVPKRKPPVE